MTDQVSDEQFKKWVREFNAIDKEIKESSSTLGQMRKRRKELDAAILSWMQGNDVARVRLSDNKFLERNIKTCQKGLNSDIIAATLQEYFRDETQAAEVTSLIYNNRPVIETEILKTVSNQKKSTIRPVDGSSVGN